MSEIWTCTELNFWKTQILKNRTSAELNTNRNTGELTPGELTFLSEVSYSLCWMSLCLVVPSSQLGQLGGSLWIQVELRGGVWVQELFEGFQMVFYC